MASICKDPNGKKRIQFVTPDGRKSVRLGKCSLRQAEAFKVRFEGLLTGQITGGLDDETARWLADLPDEMYGKLAGLGLVKPRDSMRLGLFIERYIAGRTDSSPVQQRSWATHSGTWWTSSERTERLRTSPRATRTSGGSP